MCECSWREVSRVRWRVFVSVRTFARSYAKERSTVRARTARQLGYLVSATYTIYTRFNWVKLQQKFKLDLHLSVKRKGSVLETKAYQAVGLLGPSLSLRFVDLQPSTRFSCNTIRARGHCIARCAVVHSSTFAGTKLYRCRLMWLDRPTGNGTKKLAGCTNTSDEKNRSLPTCELWVVKCSNLRVIENPQLIDI